MSGVLRIAFLCVENSCRSQIAEAFARMHGGAGVDAVSAGSRPSGSVNPKAIASMHARGYDLTTHRSKSLDDLKGRFDAVVTMGCGEACPFLNAVHRVEWNIPDPKSMDQPRFDEVRDLIEQKVQELLARLR
jgi:arsenate reductase (thioredoxin)